MSSNDQLSLEDLVEELDKETKKFTLRFKLTTISKNFIGYYFQSEDGGHTITSWRSRATVFEVPEGLSQFERNIFVKKIRVQIQNVIKNEAAKKAGTVRKIPIRFVIVQEEYL